MVSIFLRDEIIFPVVGIKLLHGSTSLTKENQTFMPFFSVL